MTSYELLLKQLGENNRYYKVVRGKAATAIHRVNYDDGNHEIVLRYHFTSVLQAFYNGDVILRSGGWHTSTTKNRINEYLPAGWFLRQKNFTWTLFTPRGEYAFFDGMKLNKEGVLLNEERDVYGNG